MIYIITKNSLGCEINRMVVDEATLQRNLLIMVRENIYAVGDTIEIVDAD